MTRFMIALSTFAVALAVSMPASAHCDTPQGPVVTAARAALEAGDPGRVLHWVRPEDEAAVEAVFEQTHVGQLWNAEAAKIAALAFGAGSLDVGVTDTDIAVDPSTVGWSRRGAEAVSLREANIEQFEELERTSIDLYAAVRTLYMQFRANEIRNGAPAEIDDIYDEGLYDDPEACDLDGVYEDPEAADAD